MPKPIRTTALTWLLALLPVIGTAQTCKTASIPATTPTSQFTINNNGTVTDTKTGLMWKRCSEGQTWNGATCRGSAFRFPWQAALQRAQTQNGIGFAGFKDWRLPNAKELFSIVEKQCFEPAINLVIFPNTVTRVGIFLYGQFWSSSLAPFDFSVWYVYFDQGRVDTEYNTSSLYVRLVRSGQ
jgi:hypothetical protein